MTHQLINTGAGWRCLRCKVAWDQGDDAPETCKAGDEYGFVTDLVPVDGLPAEGDVTFVTPKSPAEHKAFWDAQYQRLQANRVGAKSFPKPEALQGQVGGDWYKTLAIQPTEFCLRNGLDAAIHGTLKYLTRWRSKNGIEDLRKGRHFVEIREAFPYDIHPPRQIAITMLEYVTRNNIRPDDAEALYRLEAYYNAVGHHARIGADRLISEIDRLIARAG